MLDIFFTNEEDSRNGRYAVLQTDVMQKVNRNHVHRRIAKEKVAKKQEEYYLSSYYYSRYRVTSLQELGDHFSPRLPILCFCYPSTLYSPIRLHKVMR